MRIKDIMHNSFTKNEDECRDFINEDENIYKLGNKINDYTEYIDVYNSSGTKVGEVRKDTLVKVNKSIEPNLFTNVLQTLEEGVLIVDREGIILFANDQYSDMLNVALKNIIGKDIQDIEPDAEINQVLKDQEQRLLERKLIKSIDKYVTGKILPIRENQEFIGALSIFLDSTELEKLEREVTYNKQKVIELEEKLKQENGLENEIIGKDIKFKKILYKSEIAAKTDVPILISGENGTGKDVLAKYIHENSGRSEEAFVTVNCAAIPESLIESELFGYEPGSFTGGSSKGRIGKFEQANKGTLFLDEIGDMPLSMQAKILRAIQNKEIEKIGRNQSVKVDVRIITATNQNLLEMIEDNRFRRDLYYRINLVNLEIPALRERENDILLLANHFLSNYNKKYKKSVKFTKEDIKYIYENKWPGNVRELKNFIEYGVIMSLDNRFEIEYGNKDLVDKQEKYRDKNLKEQVELFEKNIIIKELERNKYNKAKTIEKLGISERTFYRKLNKYGIE